MEYVKICKLCGETFIAKSKRAEVCKSEHTSVCCVCGETFIQKPPYTSKTCSLKCGQQLGNISRKRTMQKKYGVDNPNQLQSVKDKIRSTCIERYGVDNPSKSTEIKSKIKQHFKDVYGVDNPMQVNAIYERQKDSVESHFGVRVPLQSAEVYNKMKQTNLDRYGFANILAVPEIRAAIRQKRFNQTGYYNPASDPEVKRKIEEICMQKYGVPYNCMRDECRNASSVISNINKRFGNMLEDNNIEFEFEFHIDKYSYDLKSSDILIEIDPTYTHNSFGNHWDSNGLDPSYHLNKTKLASDNGYRCIHIFDWDSWDDILNMLTPKTSIYARNCEIRLVSKSDTNEFTAQFHIQGSCKGQDICYGLYHDNQLMQLMTFGKPRYNNKYNFELLRLCTRSEYRIIGGASKLFKHFRLDHPNSSVISYCDLAKFHGDVYETIGMQLAYITEPNKIWSKDDKKITQNLLNQRGYDQLFGANYGKGTSNEQLMLDNGWLPVYDCGQAVYVYDTLS